MVCFDFTKNLKFLNLSTILSFFNFQIQKFEFLKNFFDFQSDLISNFYFLIFKYKI